MLSVLKTYTFYSEEEWQKWMLRSKKDYSRYLTFASLDSFATLLYSILCPQRPIFTGSINGLIALWVPCEFGQWWRVSGDLREEIFVFLYSSSVHHLGLTDCVPVPNVTASADGPPFL